MLTILSPIVASRSSKASPDSGLSLDYNVISLNGKISTLPRSRSDFRDGENIYVSMNL